MSFYLHQDRENSNHLKVLIATPDALITLASSRLFKLLTLSSSIADCADESR